MVQLDAPDLVRIARVAGTTEARGVILHELGHLVGLGHVKDKRQNMYPVISSRNIHYAAGDLAGLTLLGEGPCAPYL
jgi:predicted Zn-dependent protease